MIDDVITRKRNAVPDKKNTAPEKKIETGKKIETEKNSVGEKNVANDKVDEKRGGRNLVILGIASTGIAVITTVISLIIYHNSGDIYLDRSRPGYLPDEKEIEAQVESNYKFSNSGVLTANDINDYVEHFEENLGTIDDLKDPFAETPLSNASLGIPETKKEEPVPAPEPEPVVEEPVYYWW